jgi:leucyl-tRNA synthetase
MKKYDFSKIEKKYSRLWREEKTYEPDFGLTRGKKPFYNLMMFPYPSAEGLHVGNMYAFTGSDIYGRFKRMQGFEVFEPIGLDGFGIHSENYALKIGAHPMKQAEVSEKRFYKQLEMVGNGFAWEERLETYAPEYYRWTQWLFREMWKAGLAYRKKQAVNWCPSCKTVLADEQVENGKCERCGHAVEKRELEQWFLNITKYAPQLLENLDRLDWSDRVKIAQREWIGRSEGASIAFKLKGGKLKVSEIEVFTTRPDTIFGATFLVVSPETAKAWMDGGWNPEENVKEYVSSALLRRGKEGYEEREKTGVFSGADAINPATKEDIPVWISDYVLAGYGTGAIMAVPAHDERDADFAKKFGLPVSDAPLVSAEEAVKKTGGTFETKYRLRDWLISRQRYWGAPIPMVFCETCAAAGKGERSDMPGWYAVPEKDLPVELPNVKDWKPIGTGESPLASVKKFREVKCPGCGGKARRETDVSDTFLDSAWYYLGYLLASERFKKDFASAEMRKLMRAWTPVDMYIGGAEHSVLHLLYVRFVAMALRDMGHVDFDEPVKKFRAHGLLIKDGAKMSKSKGNVINPDEYVKRFGADAFRMYLMFLAPFEDGGDFRDEGLLGPVRFLERVARLSEKVKPSAENAPHTKAVHRTVKKVTEDIENLRYNTAISALMMLLNEFEKGEVSPADFDVFLKLLAPFAPFLSEELYQPGRQGAFSSIHTESWPAYDSEMTKDEAFLLILQVNGKVRGEIEVPSDITEEDAKARALQDERIVKHLGGEKPKRMVYVPGRLVNIVV